MDWTDVANQVLGNITSSVLGEAVQYQKSDTLEWFAFRGIFSHQYVGIDPDTGASHSEVHPALTVQDSELPTVPVTGDTVIVRGMTFRVDEIEVDGHTAGTSLLLKRIS